MEVLNYVSYAAYLDDFLSWNEIGSEVLSKGAALNVHNTSPPNLFSLSDNMTDKKNHKWRKFHHTIAQYNRLPHKNSLHKTFWHVIKEKYGKP